MISVEQIGLALLALLFINLFTWDLFATDKKRAVSGRSRERIPERTLMWWSMIGGSPAAWLAINRLRHKSSKASFKRPLLLITAAQLLGIAGGLWWLQP